jgi:aromatase
MVALVNKILYSGTGFMPGHTENSVVIDVPFDLVWSMTNDVESWPDLFSEYAEAEIIDRQGDTIMFRLTTRPDEMSAVYSWVSERTVNLAERIVKAHRVETGIFRFMYITWIYSDVPEGTEMRWVQDFAMKPDAPAIEQATNYINNNSVVQMTRIKGLVEAAAAAGEA